MQNTLRSDVRRTGCVFAPPKESADCMRAEPTSNSRATEQGPAANHTCRYPRHGPDHSTSYQTNRFSQKLINCELKSDGLLSSYACMHIDPSESVFLSNIVSEPVVKRQCNVAASCRNRTIYGYPCGIYANSLRLQLRNSNLIAALTLQIWGNLLTEI